MATRPEKVLPDVRKSGPGCVFVGLMLFFVPFGVLTVVGWLRPDLPGMTTEHPVLAALTLGLLWGGFAAATAPPAFRGWGFQAALDGRAGPDGVELIATRGFPFRRKTMTVPRGGTVHIAQILEFRYNLYASESPPRYSEVLLIGGGAELPFSYGGAFSVEAWETVRGWLALNSVRLATSWSDIPRMPREIPGS